MLKAFRQKNVTKMILWVTLIMILPAFVIWGAGSIGRSKDKGPTYVGLIDNKKISFDKFADSLISMRSQLALSFSSQQEALVALLKNTELIGKMAWDRLIMMAEVRKHRIKVSDKEVVNYITALPTFQRGGVFDNNVYTDVLYNKLGIDARTFEEMIRENVAIQKLYAILTKDVKVTDDEVLSRYKVDSEKFKIAYILFPADSEKKYNELRELMEKEKVTFEAAAEKLSLKVEKADLLTKSDHLEGVGEAAQVAAKCAKLKADEMSDICQTEKGQVVFKLLEIRHFDEGTFKKEKGVYSKKVLDDAKNKFLENWLRDLEARSVLKINLKDYEKYYR